MTCQNPGCRREAHGVYRCLTVTGPRVLCAGCLESLNALGMDWRRVPEWLARGMRGEARGSDQTGRLVA